MLFYRTYDNMSTPDAIEKPVADTTEEIVAEIVEDPVVEEPTKESAAATADSTSPEKPPKRVILAIPGRTFSNNFIKSWSQTLYALIDKKYEVVISNEYSSFVPFSRMQTLGLDVGRGPNQLPFNGEVDYDVWLTIDSDIVFTAEQVIELIENIDVHPVVSGLYRMQDMKHYACVQKWDDAYFIENKTFKFLTPEEVDEIKKESGEKFLKVAYNGMGFFACRRGVIESLKYPYFHREVQQIRNEDGKVVMVEMCSEDVAFCKNLIDAGHSIYVNTELRVGHEKNYII
jgi:hypothetical protein